MERDAFRRSMAELVGAFALTFVGAGSIMATGGSLLGIAAAHGLILAIMVTALGHISGGHFNPAVTFGFLITGRIVAGLAAMYWAAQLAGATLAALLLKWIFPNDVVKQFKLGAPVLNDRIAVAPGLVLEIVMTFFLVWVVFATAADPRGAFKSIAGFAIGLTIAADILMGGPLTGAAMNPSRAFGPQLVDWEWADGWIWYLGPLIGGGIAALAYEFLYLRPLRPLPVGPPETGVEEPRPGDAAVS
ncbi:MAG TPA: aquaporin [Gaiellaceae bacterium]|nr:aquaporin [Gaiellaceae bacterium]